MDKKKIIYISIILILTVILSIAYFSYAFFTHKDEQHGKLNIVTGTLKYKIESDDLTNNKITIKATTDKVYIFKLTSLNDISSSYSVYYENTSGISIGYDLNYGEAPNGTIAAHEVKSIAIRIINNTSSDKKIIIGVEGGFINNELLLSQSSYHKITDALTETTLGQVNRTIEKIKEYYRQTNPNSLVTLTFPADYSTIGISDINLTGHAYIKSDGRIGYQVENNEKCIVKRYDSENIEIFNNVNNICDKAIYKNLVINGYGEYQDNTNFSKLTYNSSDNSFYYAGRIDFQTDYFIKADTNKQYLISVDSKCSDTDNTTNYAGFGEYDYDKYWISPLEYAVYTDTLTTLARDLHKGDKIIYFTDLSNWKENVSAYYQRGIQFWGYTDGSGYTWPVNTYSRWGYDYQFENDGLNKTNNTITLRDQTNGWQGNEFPAGTQVSQKNGNSGYNYSLFSNVTLPIDYQHYQSIINTYRYGMNYIKFIALFRSNSEHTTYIKNVVVEEIN